MAFIETISPENAEGELQQIYEAVLKSRGQVAEVLMLHSLNPASLTNHLDLYMTLMFAKSPLKRKIREMIAVVVSKANNCEYCQVHHAEALNNFWKDDNRINKLRQDYQQANLDKKELVLADHAWNMTKNPAYATQEIIDNIRRAGWNDRAILDANMIISYFNFVNRMVLGLGANLESHQGKGFDYE